MVNAVLLVEVKEGHLEHVKQQIELLGAETLKEEGCILYNAYYSTNNPNTVCFVEQWESQEHLDKHLETEHIKTYRQNTADMFVSRNFNMLNKIV